MEIKDLILLMWRNVKYIILGLVLGASMGIVVSKTQAPIYEANTKVFVSQARQQNNSSMLSLSDEQLLAINLQLAKSQPVLNEVSSQLGSKVDADNIQASAIPNTLIIQIKVQDNDAQRAAAVANLLVQNLIQQNETLLSGRYLGLENAITEQVDQVQKQIDGLQTQIGQINDAGIQEQLAQVNQQIEQQKMEISALKQEIARFPSSLSPLDRITLAEKQAQLDQLHALMTLYQQIQTNLTYIGKPAQSGSSLENPQLTTLQSTLSLYQQVYQTLVNSRENVRLARTQSSQNVMQIVFATPPKSPVSPIPVLYFLLGGIVGLALTATGILMIDHLDDSLRSAGQIEKLLGLSVLGLVFENTYSKRELVTLSDPFSAEAEAFRALGASLEIIGREKKFGTLMIVNAEPSDAKTVIAANLAVINAQQGKQVILLDGDLKHPHLHHFFGMENQKGFSELLGQGLDIKNACHVVNHVDGLTLISGGMTERDSTMWLDAEKLRQLLLQLQKQADLVIVDSPSADTADAQILASKVDAVFLAIRAGHTRADAAQATLRRFQLIGARVAGAVLNRTKQYGKVNKQILTRFKIKLPKKEEPGEADGKVDASAISVS
jgi:capsular exopolysaccharide synthesis family protein